VFICFAAAAEPGLKCGRIFADIVKHSRCARSIAEAEGPRSSAGAFRRSRGVLRNGLEPSVVGFMCIKSRFAHDILLKCDRPCILHINLLLMDYIVILIISQPGCDCNNFDKNDSCFSE